MKEEYKKLEEFPTYRIYKDGRIYSEKSGRFIKSFNDNHGYQQVTLYYGSTKKERITTKVHILVARAFVPNPNGYSEINHRDEDKSNNNYNNLEWCDRSYNMKYSAESHIKYAQNNISPLTEEMVRTIPELMYNKCSIKLIASLYKVGHITIRNIIKGKTWKSLNLIFPPKTHYNSGLYKRGIVTLPKMLYDKLSSFDVDNTVLNSKVKVLESV